MQRNEAEARIASLAKEIIAVIKEYSPESDYFALAYFNDCDGETLMFNNKHWEVQNKLEYFEELDK